VSIPRRAAGDPDRSALGTAWRRTAPGPGLERPYIIPQTRSCGRNPLLLRERKSGLLLIEQIHRPLGADAGERKDGVPEHFQAGGQEGGGENFHQRVYEGYLQLLKRYPDRFAEIDCMGDKFRTSQNIVRLLTARGYLK